MQFIVVFSNMSLETVLNKDIVHNQTNFSWNKELHKSYLKERLYAR